MFHLTFLLYLLIDQKHQFMYQYRPINDCPSSIGLDFTLCPLQNGISFAFGNCPSSIPYAPVRLQSRVPCPSWNTGWVHHGPGRKQMAPSNRVMWGQFNNGSVYMVREQDLRNKQEITQYFGTGKPGVRWLPLSVNGERRKWLPGSGESSWWKGFLIVAEVWEAWWFRGPSAIKTPFFLSLTACNCFPLATSNWKPRDEHTGRFPFTSLLGREQTQAASGSQDHQRLCFARAWGVFWEKALAKARPVPGKLGRLITLDLLEQRARDLGSQSDLPQYLHFLSHNSVCFVCSSPKAVCVCACAPAGLYSHGGDG